MSTHTAQTQLQLVGKLILSGELHCETGLHIGAGKGSLEIGGADNPVVKDAFAAALPGGPGRLARLADVLGPEFRANAVEVHAERDGRTLHNFAAHLVEVADGRIAQWWMADAKPAESDEFWG